jgi:beta-lactamase class C
MSRLFWSVVILCALGGAARADAMSDAQGVAKREIERLRPADGIGGIAIALRLAGRTAFLNYGFADMSTRRPVGEDSLFNIASLRKLFEATLIADAAARGELALDDPVAKYLPELAPAAYTGRVTLRQLATYTSGLLLPQDHEPWPNWGYTLGSFIAALSAWKPYKDETPGRQHVYSHAGYVLLQLALERRFGMPIAALIEQRVTGPLQLDSTVLPPRGPDGAGQLAPALLARTVQGYGETGRPIGSPGDQQGYRSVAFLGRQYR